MQHLRRMEDRVVLLTGGGGGIARGVARAFADEGASMILTDIFPGGMEKTKAELEKDFGTDVKRWTRVQRKRSAGKKWSGFESATWRRIKPVRSQTAHHPRASSMSAHQRA